MERIQYRAHYRTVKKTKTKTLWQCMDANIIAAFNDHVKNLVLYSLCGEEPFLFFNKELI